MRAALFHEYGGPEVVRIGEVADPVPGPGEVRLAVRAAAMNHLDLWVRRGLPIDIALPHIGGSDIAGVVDAVGSGRRAGAAGDPRGGGSLAGLRLVRRNPGGAEPSAPGAPDHRRAYARRLCGVRRGAGGKPGGDPARGLVRGRRRRQPGRGHRLARGGGARAGAPPASGCW